jgi:hypothetical protein
MSQISNIWLIDFHTRRWEYMDGIYNNVIHLDKYDELWYNNIEEEDNYDEEFIYIK